MKIESKKKALMFEKSPQKVNEDHQALKIKPGRTSDRGGSRSEEYILLF